MTQTSQVVQQHSMVSSSSFNIKISYKSYMATLNIIHTRYMVHAWRWCWCELHQWMYLCLPNPAGTSFNTSITQYFGLSGSLVSGQSTERIAQVTVNTAFQFSQLTCNVTSSLLILSLVIVSRRDSWIRSLTWNWAMHTFVVDTYWHMTNVAITTSSMWSAYIISTYQLAYIAITVSSMRGTYMISTYQLPYLSYYLSYSICFRYASFAM